MNRLVPFMLGLILNFCLLAGQLEPRIEDSRQHLPESRGALDIRIHPSEGLLLPPTELLLADPGGVKLGHDPRTQMIFSEISNSSYLSESIADAETGNPGPETRILYLGSPMEGDYILWVIGTGVGTYDLEVRGNDRELAPSDVRFLKVKTVENEVHRYRIRYEGTIGHKIIAFPEP